MSIRLANKTFHVSRIFGVTFVSLASILCLYSLREQVKHRTQDSEDGEKIPNWDSVNEDESNQGTFEKLENVNSLRNGKLSGTYCSFLR